MNLRLVFTVLLTTLFSLNSGAQCIDNTACNFQNADLNPCAYPGDPCDDGNSMTFGETYNASCDCIDGTLPLSGCLDSNACNYNPLAISDDGSCIYPGDSCDDGDPNSSGDIYTNDCLCQGTYEVQFELYDTAGDGWDGSSITLINSESSEVFGPFSLGNGSFESFTIGVPSGCYEVLSTQDASPDQVSFFIESLSSDGSEDLFGIPGESQIFSVGGISGCTDPAALNYNPDATCETGDCFFCVIDGDCSYTEMDGLLGGPCNTIEICGPGKYKVLGTSHSGSLGTTECKTIYLPVPPSAYDIRLKSNPGFSMAITHNGIVRATTTSGHDNCFYVDLINCKLIRYVWDKTKTSLSMNDDFGNAWDGASYRIVDQNFAEVTSGTLLTAMLTDETHFGYDEFELDDGCYFLEFTFDDETSIENLSYRLDNIDTGFTCGRVSKNVIPFSINSTICAQGCTDSMALNYDSNASAPCKGDNSCCIYPPVNDDCENAITLTSEEIYVWNTEYATISEFSCEHVEHDIWYTYTAECDEEITFSGSGSTGFQFCIYEECPLESGNHIYSSAQNSEFLNHFSWKLDRGHTYYFRIASDSSLSTTGKGELKLTSRGCLGCTQDMAYNYDSEATLDDGSCLMPFECAGDLNGDKMVTATDLTIFLSSFGEDCTE